MRILMMVLLGLGIAVGGASVTHTQEMSVLEQQNVYICPMHPHIHGEEGDTCPICGMALVPAQHEMEEDEPSPLSAQELKGSHKITPAFIQTIGVKTAKVKQEVFGENIRAYGRVVASTRLEHVVAGRVEGWVEELSADAVGDEVTAGDLLFTLYSPDLISAQKDYLTAKAMGSKARLKATEGRLKLLGMGDKALAELKESGKALEKVPFYTPQDGVVTMLDARQGSYLKPGMRVLTVQDLSKVWVNADVPERELQFLKVGDRASVSLPGLGKTRLGKVDFIHPVIDPETRTGTVRVELENKDGALRPDSFVDVAFEAAKRHRLAVPEQAVLKSGMGDHVVRWLGEGRFKPVMVQTGVNADGLVEIRDGLKAGQEIVISGQFLLDAEANLKGGMGGMVHSEHGNMDMNQGDANRPQAEGNPHAGH